MNVLVTKLQCINYSKLHKIENTILFTNESWTEFNSIERNISKCSADKCFFGFIIRMN